MTPFRDTGYDDRDNYSSSVEGAAAAAAYHALDYRDVPSLDELDDDFWRGADALADRIEQRNQQPSEQRNEQRVKED